MIDDRLAYQMAMNVFEQGVECDIAARHIRRELPLFFLKVRDKVKVEMADSERGWEYNPAKERDISK